MKGLLRLLGAGAVLLALATPAASAQQVEMSGKWVVTPYAGVYLPTTDLAVINAADVGTTANITLKHQTGFAFGGNVSYWIAPRTAIELGGVYAISDAKASASIFGPGGPTMAGTNTENAWVALGSVKAMFNLMPLDSRYNLRLGVGPAIIQHGGTAYKFDDGSKIDGRTNVGGAVSLCTKVPLTSSIGLRLRGESYLYQSQLKFKDPADPTNNFSFDKKFQNDMMLTAGLQFLLPR